MEQITFTAQELDQIVGFINKIPTEFGRPLLNYLEVILQKKVQENEEKGNGKKTTDSKEPEAYPETNFPEKV